MKPLIAVLALFLLVPQAALADDSDDGKPAPGSICIQTIEGPTRCITPGSDESN